MEAEVRPAWWPVVALAILGESAAALEFDADGTLSLSRSFMPVALGSAGTIFGVLIGPFILAFVGGWLGGNADPAEIRQAVAWSYAPFAVGGLGWMPVAILYRDRSSDMPVTLLPLVLAALIGALWSLVTQVAMLAEVQQFSILRAIASIVIVLIPTLLLGSL